MTEDSINRLLEARRKAMEERARADSDIAAIDRVLPLLGVRNDELQDSATETNETSESLSVARESVPPPLQGIEKPSPPSGRSKKIRITQEIRRAIQEFQGEFTQHDVVEWIKDKHPSIQVRSATVSSALWRMAKQGAIEKVQEGYGSDPNTYRRASHDSVVQEGFPDEEHTSDEGSNVSERDLMSE